MQTWSHVAPILSADTIVGTFVCNPTNPWFYILTKLIIPLSLDNTNMDISMISTHHGLAGQIQQRKVFFPANKSLLHPDHNHFAPPLVTRVRTQANHCHNKQLLESWIRLLKHCLKAPQARTMSSAFKRPCPVAHISISNTLCIFPRKNLFSKIK